MIIILVGSRTIPRKTFDNGVACGIEGNTSLRRKVGMVSERLGFMFSVTESVLNRITVDLSTIGQHNRVERPELQATLYLRRNEMARYVKMIKGLTGVRAVGINDYPSRQEADNAPELEERTSEVVRILNADEEKEFAGEWWKRAFRPDNPKDLVDAKIFFEKEWKEQEK